MASLFERLEAARPGLEAASGPGPGSAVAESVLANIRGVLNMRQGCCQIRPDYGLPDLNGLAGEGGNAVFAIARAVKAQLDAFEPRLRDVAVRPLTLPDVPGELAFAVSAILDDGRDGRTLRFETVLSEDRRVRLRV